MKEIVKVTDQYSIVIFADNSGRSCASLVKETPKAKCSTSKTVKSHFFKSKEKRDVWAIQISSRILADVREKADRKRKEREAAKTAQVKAGDIFVYSWGYEQTNIDFYEVVKVSGQTIEMKELNQEREHTEWMQGKCVPVPGSYKKDGETWRKRIRVSQDKPYVSTSYGWCELWDGKPENWTAYA